MKIVFVNGGFDILHTGHFFFLQYCQTYAFNKGAQLIVAIDSDDKIKNDKGPSRPYFTAKERTQQILTCFSNTIVKIFNTNEDLLCMIKEYKPTYLIKDIQWKGNVIGEKYAKNIIFNTNKLPISTTEIEKRVLKNNA